MESVQTHTHIPENPDPCCNNETAAPDNFRKPLKPQNACIEKIVSVLPLRQILALLRLGRETGFHTCGIQFSFA